MAYLQFTVKCIFIQVLLFYIIVEALDLGDMYLLNGGKGNNLYFRPEEENFDVNDYNDMFGIAKFGRPLYCYLNAAPGNCLAYNKMYYFNRKTHRCEKFIYGGCGGNANRFTTLSECLYRCKVYKSLITLQEE